jgi:hypothetical protein
MSAFNALCEWERTSLDDLAGLVWQQVGRQLGQPDTAAGRRAVLWAIVGPNPTVELRACSMDGKKSFLLE